MKNKIALTLLFFPFVWQTGFAQNIGISTNGATPRDCAMLDILSTSKGLLIPNLALTSLTTYAPATGTAVDGLLIYNTASGVGNGTGYYYWSTVATAHWVNLLDNFPGGDWDLLGNTGLTSPAVPATYGTSTIGAAENWLGTIDSKDVVLGTNNIERMRIKQTTGYVGIGVASPGTRLTVAGDGTGYASIGGGFCGGNYTGISLNGQAPNGACTNYNILSSPSDFNFYLNRPSGNEMHFREANGDQMIISSGGYVGINVTPSASYQLYVSTAVTGAINGVTTNAASGSYGVHGNGNINNDGYLGYLLPSTTYGGIATVLNPGGYFTGNGNNAVVGITSSANTAIVGIVTANASAGVRGINSAAAGAGTGMGGLFATLQTGGSGASGCIGGSWFFAGAGIGGITSGPAGSFGTIGQVTSTANGTGYGVNSITNLGVEGQQSGNFTYSFGVGALSTSTATRCGGVLGLAPTTGSWGACGYYNSGGSTYGLYYTSSGTGTGFLPDGVITGIGSGGRGGIIGSWTRGDVMGQISSGELFAVYNLGNAYTSGFSAEVVTLREKRVAAYSITSTDIKVYNDGTSKLTNGTTRVNFEQTFTELVGDNKPVVTITPMGQCNGIYISHIDSKGFDVAELGNGTSNVEFSYIVISKRIDAGNKPQLPEALAKKDFDENMKGVMFNENNKEQSAKPIWWDGKQVRFDTPPARSAENFHKTKEAIPTSPEGGKPAGK